MSILLLLLLLLLLALAVGGALPLSSFPPLPPNSQFIMAPGGLRQREGEGGDGGEEKGVSRKAQADDVALKARGS